jgi:hypothetical protein
VAQPTVQRPTVQQPTVNRGGGAAPAVGRATPAPTVNAGSGNMGGGGGGYDRGDRASAFSGVDRGAEVNRSSNRGAVSRGNVSRGGGGRGGGGGRR